MINLPTEITERQKQALINLHNAINAAKQNGVMVSQSVDDDTHTLVIYDFGFEKEYILHAN